MPDNLAPAVLAPKTGNERRFLLPEAPLAHKKGDELAFIPGDNPAIPECRPYAQAQLSLGIRRR